MHLVSLPLAESPAPFSSHWLDEHDQHTIGAGVRLRIPWQFQELTDTAISYYITNKSLLGLLVGVAEHYLEAAGGDTSVIDNDEMFFMEGHFLYDLLLDLFFPILDNDIYLALSVFYRGGVSMRVWNDSIDSDDSDDLHHPVPGIGRMYAVNKSTK